MVCHFLPSTETISSISTVFFMKQNTNTTIIKAIKLENAKDETKAKIVDVHVVLYSCRFQNGMSLFIFY